MSKQFTVMMQNFNNETTIFCFHNHRDYTHFMQGFDKEYTFFFQLIDKRKKEDCLPNHEAQPCHL